MFDRSDQWLARRKSHLVDGPTAETFVLPSGIQIESSDTRIRFRGSAASIAALEPEFSKLERSSNGAEARVDDWTFEVDDSSPDTGRPRRLVLPWHSWGIVGSLFRDVAYGYLPTPFDFSSAGYVAATDDSGAPSIAGRLDIGVIIEGPVLRDSTR